MSIPTSPASEFLLTWHGPFSFVPVQGVQRIFDDELASSPGLYVWVIPYEGGWLVYYVGETGKGQTGRYGVRFGQELARFYHGREWIADPVLFGRGDKRFIYQPKNSKQANLPEFRNREHELRPSIDQMLLMLRLFVAPLEEADTTRKSVERCLMWDVRDAGGLCADFIGIYPTSYGRTRPLISLRHRSPFPLWGITEQLSEGNKGPSPAILT